ncbi:hypothetical protein [Erythrobacter sp.]|uniref:hypothetical protein n=1 Tax=Erythrobacter sp. TaxID=1042 RepID=UPI003C734BC3
MPIYGASQAGAVLRYRIAPSSPHDPHAMARVYRALVPGGESEFAVGASARPLSAVPVRVVAEVRATDGPAGVELGPAAFAYTEIPPIDLPAGFSLEAYGGAGYVAGEAATAFVDGQVVAMREMYEAPPATIGAPRVSVGAGAWGGAQEDAGRLDVGPSVRVDLEIADVPARLSIDYRRKVAGDAAPRSGLTATLSTRF